MRKTAALKGVSCVVAFLLLVLTVVPSIPATYVSVSRGERLHTVVVEGVGLEGLSHYTVTLNESRYCSLLGYLADFRSRLNASRSDMETRTIYQEVFVGLGAYQIFPQAMNGTNVWHRILNAGTNENIFGALSTNSSVNYCCLTSGMLGGRSCAFVTPSVCLLWPVMMALLFIQSIFSNYGGPIPLLMGLLALPIMYFMRVSISVNNILPVSFLNTIIGPAQGWVHTLGFTGTKTWEGNLTGTLPNHFMDNLLVSGFTGLKMYLSDEGTYYIIGTSVAVGISTN